MKRQYPIWFPAWVLFLLIGMTGCDRRPLEEAYFTTALIGISIDWSQSRIPQTAEGRYDIHRATVIFFPLSGETPLEYQLESNITYREIDVPIGTYAVIVFNETTDLEDWTNTYFAGTHCYETFAAYTRPETQKGFYSRATEETLVMQPEPLAVWAMDCFEVTNEMVELSRASTRNGTRMSVQLKTVPQSRTEIVEVKTRVINLSSAVQATGIVKGLVIGVMMASGQCINQFASHAIILNGRQMEKNGKDGTVHAKLRVFGILPDVLYTLHTDFVLTNGTLYAPPDIVNANLFKPNKGDDTVDYLIDVGIGSSTLPTPGDPNPHPDIPPFELPDTGANADVEVGGWDEIVIPMN